MDKCGKCEKSGEKTPTMAKTTCDFLGKLSDDHCGRLLWPGTQYAEVQPKDFK